MEDEKQKKFKNSFHLRIYDLETLKSVNELIQTGTFDSANDLLNRAVQLGIEQIYLEYGKKKALAPPPTINEPDSSKLDTAVHILRENEVLTQDIFIMMNVIESLSATVLNVMRASNNGEEITDKLIESGYYSELPPYYLEIKEQLTKRYTRAALKKDKKQ